VASNERQMPPFGSLQRSRRPVSACLVEFGRPTFVETPSLQRGCLGSVVRQPGVWPEIRRCRS
jgi:hypothetical protein